MAMDKITEQTTSTLDNKRQQISKKVWDLEGKKERIINVGSTGNVPLNMYKKIEENKLIATDYVHEVTGEDYRQYLIKINNKILKVDLKET